MAQAPSVARNDEGPGPGIMSLAWAFALERVTGIEPALSAWEADVLPLNYTRERPHCTRLSGFVAQPPRADTGRPGVAQLPPDLAMPRDAERWPAGAYELAAATRGRPKLATGSRHDRVIGG